MLTQQGKLISDAEEEEVAINIDNLYGHLLFQKSLYSFTEYCLRGDLKHFRAAQRSSDKSYHFFQQIGDARLGVIASELRTLLKLFEDQSTWSNIKRHGGSLIQSPIWTTYLPKFRPK